YPPVEVEVVENVSPVVALVSVRVASGTMAPVGSVTVPLIPPVTIVCADPAQARNKHSRTAITELIHSFFVMIKDSPLQEFNSLYHDHSLWPPLALAQI